MPLKSKFNAAMEEILESKDNTFIIDPNVVINQDDFDGFGFLTEEEEILESHQ